VGSGGVRVFQIVTAKRDHFAVTADRFLLVFVAVVPEMALHKPCLGMARINIQYPIKKYLGNLPTFFRDCACCMTPVYGYDSTIIRWIDVRRCGRKLRRLHFVSNKKMNWKI
jgi:hypothetical protein